MKLVKPYVKYVQNKDNYEHIAKAARICYASEAEGKNNYEFVENLWLKRNHRSPYRHGTLYYEIGDSFPRLLAKFINNPYCTCIHIEKEYTWLISTNCQFVRELNPKILKTLDNFSINEEYIYEYAKEYPEVLDIIRISFEIQTQISTSRELNRVSPNNICEQSTRYCNFANKKFGEHISFCEPHWLDATTYYEYKYENEEHLDKEYPADERLFVDHYYEDKREIYAIVNNVEYLVNNDYPIATKGIPQKDGSNLCYSPYIAIEWLKQCLDGERRYFHVLTYGMKPQDARGFLPIDTATKCFYTYSIKEWKHILDLRYKGTTGDPHPNAKIVATEIYNILKELCLLINYE